MFTVFTINHNIKQYKQRTFNPNIEAHSRNHFAVEKR